MKIHFLLAAFTILLLAVAACEQAPKQQEEQDQSADQTAMYIERGLEIAGATQAAMSSQLKAAMKAGGVPNAVQYCNVAAHPIADSMSQVYNATISRKTNQARNPNNKIQSELEREVFQIFQEKWDTDEKMQPVVRHLNGEEVAFFAPIMAQELCLNCHGKMGETLLAANYEHIQSLYPEDEATGYAAGDLRGMWHIVLKK
jgi:hypothetical protein